MLLFFATTFVLLGFLLLVILNSKRSRWATADEDADDNYEKIIEPTEQVFATAVYMKFDKDNEHREIYTGQVRSRSHSLEISTTPTKGGTNKEIV